MKRYILRTIAILAGLLSHNLVLAQTPNIATIAGELLLSGNQACFDAELSNSGSPGFGPYLRLTVPPEVSFDSATFSGSAVSTAAIGVFPAAPGNQLTDPLTGGVVTGPEGASLFALHYPLGSVVTAGPALPMAICATVASGTSPGLALPLVVQPVYRYGDTATGINGPIEGASQNATLTSGLVVIDKSNAANEGEAAPGGVGVYEQGFTVNIDVAAGHSIFDLVVDDLLPAGMQYVGPVTISGGINGVALLEPSTVTPGGTLRVAFDRIDGVVGNEVTISYLTRVPDVLDESNCSVSTLTNNLAFDYEFPDDTPQASLLSNSDITAKHIVLQQGVASSQAVSGDTVTFTQQFAVSSFAAADTVELTVTLNDGFTFGSHLTLDLGSGNVAIVPTVMVDGSGVTTVTYDITAVAGTINGDVQGTVTFTATIDEIYTASGQPVLAGDHLTSDATLSYDLTAGAAACSDNSGSAVAVPDALFSKSIVNPLPQYAPGDTITFRLSAEIASGDAADIVFEDYWPLPVFDVTNLDTTFGGPDIMLSPTDTAGLVPSSILVDAGANSLRVEWPDLSSNPSVVETIAIDVQMTVVDSPFADDLSLTNLLTGASENSAAELSESTATVGLMVGAPALEITKGIFASDNAAADATISPPPASLPVDGDISASDAGDTLTYVLSVENVGNAFAYDVVVQDPAVSALTGAALVSVENRQGQALPTTGSLSSGLMIDQPIPPARDFEIRATMEAILFTDGNMDGNPDAGDEIEYRVHVLNNGGAVTNAVFDIVLPAEVTYVGGSLASSQGVEDDGSAPTLSVALGALLAADSEIISFRVTVDALPAGTPIATQGSFNSDQTELTLTDGNDSAADGQQANTLVVDSVLPVQPGPPVLQDESVLITVNYTLGSSVQPGQEIINTASVTWASGPGATVFPAVTDDATVTISEPSLNKSVTAIAPGYAGNLSEAHIGEVITYSLVLTLPEGQSQNVVLTDLLDSGLAMTDVVSITPSSGDVTTDAVGGFLGVLAGAAFSNQGGGSHQLDRQLTLNFGTVSNASIDDATAETITVVARARVLNWDSNARGNNRNNDASWSWNNPNGPGSLSTSDNAPNVTIIEPALTITKALSAASADAGDVLTVTLDIAHSGASNADAHDVALQDILPSGLTFAGGFSSSGVAPTTGPSHSAGTVSAFWDSLADGSTAQVTFNVTVDGTVTPQSTVDNTASVQWQSLQMADEAVLPTPPNNTLGVERTGSPADPGGTANTYQDQDGDDFSVPSIAVSKSVDSISPSGASPNVTVSDRVVWRFTVTLPEGTTPGLQLLDDLPPGFAFQSAMIDATGFAGSASITSAMVTGGTVDAGQQVTISLGSPTVNGDNIGFNNSFAVMLETLVVDSVANAALFAVQNKTNTVTASHTGSMGVIQDTASTNFAEPDLQIVKQMNKTSDLQAGESVMITLTVTNNGTAPAYDLTVTDVLNDDGTAFDLSSVGPLTIPAGYSYNYSSPTVTVSANAGTSLAAGAMVSFTFSVDIVDSVLSGSSFGNTASVAGNGNDGTPTDAERDSNDSDTVSFTTAAPASGKQLIGSSETWTSDTAPIEAAIGELLSFELSFTLPEGTTAADGNLVVDTLPAGTEYVVGSGSIRSISDVMMTATNFALSAWGSGTAFTRDASLQRLNSVCAGDSNAMNAYGTAQWSGLASDSFGGLGTHAVSCGVPADLLISEYVEGSGSNQALEFFNGTGGLIDLGAGNYLIEIYADGATVPTQTILLAGNVADGATHVLGNSAAVAGITAVSDQTDGGAWFDGNDAIVLKSGGAGGVIIDSIGQIGPLDVIPTTAVPLEPTVNGQDLEFDLGDVTNHDVDGAANDEQLLLSYDLLMLNSADNNRTDSKSNTATLNYLNRDGMGQQLSESVTWTVAEPDLTQSKVADMTTVSGGDTVTFTATLTNTAGTNVTRAWDAAIADTLPAEYENVMLVSATLSRGAVDLSGSASVLGNAVALDMSTLTVAERYLAPGDFLQLVYTADVNGSIGFEQQVVNTALGTATSLPGSNGTADVTPGAAGSGTGERTGSGGAENDLRSMAMRTVTADRPTITKTGDANLAIGQTTSMSVSVDVPIGTTNNFVLSDNLPAGLSYTGVPIIINLPASNFSTSLSPSTTPGAGTDPLVFDFGTVTNSGSTAQTISISYQVRVDNVLANQQGTTLDNTASLSYQNASMPLPSDSATITVVEPNLEITKTITAGAAGSDAGDAIDYQVVVANSSATATAYRVDLMDVLPAGLLGGTPTFDSIAVDNDGGAVVRNSGGALVAGDAIITTSTITDDTLSWPLLDIPPSAVLTITYTAVTADTVFAGQMLTNNVTASYNSLSAGGGRDSTDSVDDDDGNLDNYGETDSQTLTIDSSLAVQKTLNAIHMGNDFTVGDLITFDIRVDLVEGVTQSVVVTDVLPGGLVFDSLVGVVASSNISYDGAGSAVEAPIGTITVDLGNVTNTPDGSTSNDFLIVRLAARVSNTAGNVAGAMASNSASVSSNAGSAGPDTTTIDIVEPALTVTKAASTSTPSLGEEVTFTVTVAHAASAADAFDVLLTDVIPAGLTYISGSQMGAGTVDEGVPGQPVFDLGSLTLAEGSKQFTFQCVVDLDATVGQVITNSIDLAYDGQAGMPVVERSYATSGSADVTPTTAATIDARKIVAISLDGGTIGVADTGDELTYTITLNNTGPDVTGVEFTDGIPANTTYVAASLTSSHGSVDDSGDPLSVDVGAMATNDVVTISFAVTIDGGTPFGTVISNQGEVDSDQSVPEPTDVDGVDQNGDQPTDITVGAAPVVRDPLYVQKLVEWVTDSDASGDVTAGDVMRYVVVARNDGQQALTSVNIADTIPAGLTVVAASENSSAGLISIVGQAASWSVASLPAGAVETAQFDVTIDVFAPMSMRFTNQASADSDQTDPSVSDANGDADDGLQATAFSAVNGIAGVAALDVEKRWSLFSDVDGDGLVDPGDTIAYQVTLINAGSATASNVRLADTVPADTSIVAGSVSSSSGVVVGEDPIDVNIGAIDPGAVVTVTFRVTVDGGTPDGTIVSNQAVASADGGINEPSDDNGDDADGKNPTLTPVDTGGGSAAGTPSGLNKALFASSEADSSASNVLVGEVLTYRLAFSAPVGTLNEVAISDTLPAGLSYVSGTARLARTFDTGLSASANPGGVNSAASGTFVSLVDGTDVLVIGSALELYLGAIINSDNDGDAETYVFEYQVVVANSAGVQAGIDLNNSGVLEFQDQLGQTASLTPVSSTVTVIEPVLGLSKSVSPSVLLTSGGTTTFTLVLSNPAGGFNGPAYDVNLLDSLPPAFTSMTVDSITPSGGVSGITDNSAGTTLDIDIATVPTGGQMTVVFSASAPGALSEGTLTNTANMSWTSLPGSNGTGSATPGAAGTIDGERTGGGAVNDHFTSDSADVVVGSVNLSKQVLMPQTRYAIGDVVEYQLQLSTPPGSALSNTQISDVLDEGLTYVTGSLNVAYGAGTTSGSTPIEFTRSDNTPIAGQETLALNFATVTAPAASAGSITLTYQAVVDNILVNQDNQSLGNAAVVTFTDPGTGSPTMDSASASVTVGEPHLTLTKTLTGPVVNLDAGDTVSYQVNIGNDGTTTAYETVISDVLPSGLENVSNLQVTATSGGAQTPVLTNNGNDWSTSVFDVPVGGVVTITFDAMLSTSVIPGQSIQNSVEASFTSRDGADSNERDGSSPGSNQDDDSDLNNYASSATSPVLTVSEQVAINKAFHPDPATTSYTIGELVSYRLTVSLIEGLTADVVVADTLPDGLSYQSSTVGVGNVGMTTAYSGTPGQAGQVLTFDLGDISNPANGSDSDDFITVDIVAVVDNTPANQDGAVLGNNAAVSYTAASGSRTVDFDADSMTPGIQPLDLTVIMPDLVVAKSVGSTTPSLGDELQFTLTLSHSVASSADAYDLMLVDILPMGLTYVTGSASQSVIVSGQQLLFDVVTLPLAGSPLVVSYRATVDTGAMAGSPLTNTADLQWTTRPGMVAGERTGDDGAAGLNDLVSSDQASVTPVDPGTPAGLDASKTVTISIDGGNAGVADPGDQLTYTIIIGNQSMPASGVLLTDMIPVNTTYVAASLTSSQGTVDDSGDPLLVDVGSLAASGSVTISFAVTVDAGTPAGTIISNQGMVDSDGAVPEPTDADGIDANGDQATELTVGGPPPTDNALHVQKLVQWVTDADASMDITAGDTMRYLFVLRNLGSEPLTGVSFSDTLPSGLTFVSASQSQSSGVLTVMGSTIQLSGASISVGSTETAQFDVTVDAFVGTTADFVNQAVVRSDQTADGLSDANSDQSDGAQETMFSAVNGIAGSPALDLQKRLSLAVDSDGDGQVDPGDRVAYQLTLSNTGSAAANNARLIDTLPAATTIVSGSVTSSSGIVVSEDPIDINLGTLAAGAYVTASFEVTVNGGTADGTVVPNQALATSDNAPDQPSDDNGAPGDGENPTLFVVDTGGGGSAPSGLTKSAIASSEPASTLLDVLVGELVTFELSFNAPVGTLDQVTLSDTLPPGLSYVAGSAQLRRTFDTGLTSSVNPGGINAAPSGSLVPLIDGVDLNLVASSIELTLGSVINSDADANSEGYTLRYQAQVENVAANQAGVALHNSGGLSFVDALNQPSTLSPVVQSLTVIEPTVTLQKQVSPGALLLSGGDVVFTLILTNPVGANSATAYDVGLTDSLPAEFGSLVVDSIAPSGGAMGIVDNSAGTILDIGVAEIPPGGALTVTMTASAAGPLTAGSIVNTGDLNWTSLPGDNGTASATPGLPGQTDGERTGVGGVNDHFVSDSATINVGTVNLVKALDTPQSRYAIGDLVQYRVTMSLPAAGQFNDATFTDVLDAGLSYQLGSLSIVYGVGSSSTLNPLEFTRTDNTPVPGAETLVLEFGSLLAGSGGGSVELTYFAVVDNVLSNQAGQLLNNVATLRLDDPGTGVPFELQSSQLLTVGEPSLSMSKALLTSSVGLDAGDGVAYEVVVANSGLTTAYEAVLADALPTGLENISNLLIASTSGGAPTPILTNNGAGWSTGEFDLPPGGSITITFEATLGAGVIPGQLIQNEVTGRYSSRDGVDANERDFSSPGSNQGDDSDLNNYNAQALAAVISVADPVALDKAFYPDPVDIGYTIGEEIGYRLTIDLLEGTVPSLQLDDVLPDGVTYVSSLVGLGNMGMSSDYIGSPLLSGQTLTFDFGTVQNPANGNDADDYITVDIVARVDNLAANQSGVLLGNNASLQFLTGSGLQQRDFDADALTPGIQPLTAEVEVPQLAISKMASTSTPARADEVEFVLTITHTASSDVDAFDALVVDTLPAGLSYVPGSASQAVTVTGQVLAFEVVSIPLAGAPLQISYRALLDANAALGVPLSNLVDLTWTTRPDVAAGERTGVDGVGGLNDLATGTTATVTPTGTDLSALKSDLLLIDVGSDGSANSGDTLRYSIDLSNAGNATATGQEFIDSLGPNLQLVVGSVVTSTGTVTSGNAAGDSQVVVAVGDLPASGGASISFDAMILGPLPVGTTMVTNQGQLSGPDGVVQTDDPDTPATNDATVTPVIPLADIAIVKTGPVDPVVAGTAFSYDLLVSNAGPDAASDVLLTDVLPASLQFLAATPSQGTCQFDNGSTTLMCMPGALAVGDAANIELQVVLLDEGDTVNVATVAADQLDPNASNDAGNATIMGVPGIDLELQKQVDNPNPDWGDSIDYTLILSNLGPDTATGIEVLDLLPVELQFESAHASLGTYDPVDGRWLINTLSANESQTLTITATVMGLGTLVNQAEVVAADQQDVDSVPGNGDPGEDDQAEVSIVVDTLTDLSVSKSVAEPRVDAGADLAFTIVVNNLGPSPASGVTVQEFLPVELGFVSASTTQGTYDGVSGQWAVGALPADGSATLLLQARALSTASGRTVLNAVTVVGNEPDPELNNNQAEVLAAVRPLPIPMLSTWGLLFLTLMLAVATWWSAALLNRDG